MDRRQLLKGFFAVAAATTVKLPPVVEEISYQFKLYRPKNMFVIMQEFEEDMMTPILNRMLEIVKEQDTQ